MKRPFIFLFGCGLPALLAAPLAYAQSDGEAEATAPAAGAALGNPVILTLAILIAVAVVVALVVWSRRASRRRAEEAFPHTYAGGYESVMPNPNKKREPSLRPMMLKAVADERTDTVIAPWSVPADFDVPRFLRKSKAAFIRLQASWDQADLKDIRRFTTRELYGEFAKQLKERGDRVDATEVVTVGAELQGVETVGDYHVATVQFTGMIKDELGAEAAPFSEVWKLSKPLDGHRSWVVTQIQQH